MTTDPAFRVAVFAPLFPPAQKGGGPIRSIGALVDHVPVGYDLRVIARNTDLDERTPMDVVSDQWLPWRDRVLVRYVSNGNTLRYVQALLAIRRYRPELIYLQSFWSFGSGLLIQLLAAFGFFGRVVILVAPRGQFTSAALGIKSTKKVLTLRLFRLTGLHRRLIWHATSEGESHSISAVWGDSARIVVRTEDTLLPKVADGPPDRAASDGLRAVHIARCVPIKGLDILLDGLKTISAPISLDVFGSSEDREFAAACTERAACLPDNVTVRFLGHLDHEQVRETISRYDAFLLPTKGENFGHAIPEALSVVPALLPDTTPWTDVLLQGGGVVVDPNNAQTWRDAIQASPTQVRRSGFDARTVLGGFTQSGCPHAAQPHLFDLVRRDSANTDIINPRKRLASGADP